MSARIKVYSFLLNCKYCETHPLVLNPVDMSMKGCDSRSDVTACQSQGAECQGGRLLATRPARTLICNESEETGPSHRE